MFFFATLIWCASQALAFNPAAYPAPPSPSSELVTSTVAGKVTNPAGEPLPGVVVLVQGTTQATSTNAAGEFLVQLSNSKSMLLFSYQGYRDKVLEVASGDPLQVQMHPVTSSLTSASLAGSTVLAEPNSEVLNYSDELPKFPGDEAAYRAFMRQNAKYPKQALEHQVQGTVFVSFVVDEQGRITDAKVVKGCGYGLDEEALRLIRIMPWWSPGKMAGKPVRVSRVLPVPFAYQEKR
ncbi:TonB family protein [Hymenobacter wooponensis]|uniref:TonB family protein n=1 Tax=Hymenobacter wooponensis TaxID=1525360 RepID=A0A4Z0MQG2_9BACT|nr:TonB family protein [Hymenobacter wooponensis]TGD81640.1 TonB family protein [Hymenobacter wooponensis]